MTDQSSAVTSKRPLQYTVYTSALVSAAVTAAFTFTLSRNAFIAGATGGCQVVLNLLVHTFICRSAARRQRAGSSALAAPCVIWFTGLPSAGKTTLALLLKEALENAGTKVEHLDGDTVRSVLPGIGFSRAERNDHIRRMGFLASRLEQQGVTVIASFVSPYRESRAFTRRICRDFVEVYLSTSIDECSRRDVKGLYQESKEGKRPGMTGVDDPYEPPLEPEIVLDTAKLTKEECVQSILQHLRSRASARGDVSIGSAAQEQEHGSSVATRTR